jgi:hypothetical protein
MKIILRVINKSTQEELYIADDIKTYNREETIALVGKGKIAGLALAKRKNRQYVRSKPNDKTIDNLSSRSLSYTELLLFYRDYFQAILDKKIKEYDALRRKRRKEAFIVVKDDRGDFVSTKTTENIHKYLAKYRSVILEAAKKQRIDPVLLGAILIDEYCRMGWDDWLDWLSALNVKNTSIGVAQVKLSTAREILRKQYYNPADGKLTPASSSIQMWFYLNQPEYSIWFAAAAVRLSIDYWKKRKIDISRQPRVLAYLYSRGYANDIKGATGKRCTQISTAFYRMAKAVLC